MAKPAKKIMILPDAHFPHQDALAMACVQAAVVAVDPDEIVVLGDWLDGGPFSSHVSHTFEEGAHDFLEQEIAPCNEALDALQYRGKNNKPRKLAYLEGNHEARVKRHLIANGGKAGKSLAALSDPEKLLRNRVDAEGVPGERRKSFKWIPYMGKGTHSHYPIAPDLIAIHGWSFAADFNRVNYRAAPSVSIVCGHTHRAASFTTRDAMTDERRRYWSPGCLCGLKPNYTANNPNTWTQGFSIVYQSRRHPTNWTSYDIPIENGYCVLPGGAEISA